VRIFTRPYSQIDMSIAQQIINDLFPGSRLDFDAIGAAHGDRVRVEVADEFDRLGMVLSTNGVVGEVSMCPACDGEGEDGRGRVCALCEGFSTVVDYGRGLRAFKD